MGTDQWICAVCGEVSEQMHLEGGQADAPPDFDSRPGEPVRSTIRHWMHACPHCGYAAPDLRVSAGEAATIIRDPAYLDLRRRHSVPAGARRFLCHSFILEKTGDFADAGWTALHAAWFSDDESDDASAAHCRREAIRLWKLAKLNAQNFGEDHLHEFALVTDVLRRASEFEAAREACLEALQLDDLDPILEDMLRLQLTLIQRRDTSRHSLEEILDRPRGGERVTLQ